MTQPALPTILLVDDVEDDILLIRRVFTQAGVPHPFQVVKNGAEAMAYLSSKPPFDDRSTYPPPGLILLDLKMPGLSGFEVLKWLRAQPELRAVRVIVLTSSNDTHDVDLAYRLGANSYLTKTSDIELFVRNARALAVYWLDLDHLGDASPPPAW